MVIRWNVLLSQVLRQCEVVLAGERFIRIRKIAPYSEYKVARSYGVATIYDGENMGSYITLNVEQPRT